jgi:hypothetical protein
VTPEEKASLTELQFMRSRIPALDALSTFVPTGEESDADISAAISRKGFSRWFPASGGHRLLIPFEGEKYDPARFTVEPKAWDHETCKICRISIPSMTLCWVTTNGPCIILCENCHSEAFGNATQTT